MFDRRQVVDHRIEKKTVVEKILRNQKCSCQSECCPAWSLLLLLLLLTIDYYYWVCGTTIEEWE